MTGASGQGLAANGSGRESTVENLRGSSITAFDDQGAAVADATDLHGATSTAVRTMARQIAARLATRPSLAVHRPRRGGDPRSEPYREGADEIDLDAAVEALGENPCLGPEEILVRERRHSRRTIVLAVDVSGSMRGERLKTAAATVGALAGELSRDDLAVVAFWSDAAAVLRLGERSTLEEVVDQILGIEAAGLTNVSFPLELAVEELRRVSGTERRAILLSDCVHNAGPDPRRAAASLPRLDVLLDVSARHDEMLGDQLARNGRGVAFRIRHHRDVAPALGQMLGG